MPENPTPAENIPNFLTADAARQMAVEVKSRDAALNTVFGLIQAAAQSGALYLEYEPEQQDYTAILNILTGAGFTVEEQVEMPPDPEPVEGYEPEPPTPVRKYFIIKWPLS